MSLLHRALYRMAEQMTGRDITRFVEELRCHDQLDHAQLELIQLQRLKVILRYAQERIPYYKNLFNRCGMDVAQINSLQDLEKLPLLTKTEILRDPEQFWPQGPDRKHLRRSGGSTGERLPVYYDDEGLDRTAAMQTRMMEWCGKQPGEFEVHFASTTLVSMSRRDRVREFAKSAALNRQNIFVDLFHDERYAEILQALSSSRPKLVQGYPSIAYQLACYAERTGRNCRNLFSLLEVEGETLHEFQRQKIEQVFGCEVFNRYGSAEFGIVAHECRQHAGLHVRSDMVVVETVPVDSPSAAADGSLQEIVATGLTNRGMPLIRYRTGDLGLLDPSPCACGLPYPKLRQVTGRIHELIYLEGLGYVATYVILNSLERLGIVRNFQLAKTERGLRVYLLLDREGNLESLRQVQSTIWQSNRLGKYRLDFEIVAALPVSPRGKFRYVVDDRGLAGERVVLLATEYGEIADAAGWMEDAK